MQKRAPTLANILVICLFALSCFGLLLFLWESFGGSIPLKPKGYRFTVVFPRTIALAEQSDVRISGVDVGHVISLKADPDGLTHATVEINSQYAPLHDNIHAILRQKTLLGETYVQLIPGSRDSPYLPDGAVLPRAQVEEPVTLDNILSAFDPRTRHAYRVWMQALAGSVIGRGEDINASFAALQPFVEQTNKLVGIAAEQEGALSAVVRNTGVVFGALAEREGQFRGLIVHGEQTFHAAAQSSQAFAEAFRLLPAFEHNSTVALRSFEVFAANTSPLLDQLRPSQVQLAALTKGAETFAPQLNDLLTGLGPLTSASKQGLPALDRSLNLFVPILSELDPFTRNFNPFLEFVGRYVPELQAFFANFTAASQATVQEGGTAGPRLHYVRAMLPINPDSLSVYPRRTGFNRSNPYQQPGAFRALSNGGLPVFSNGACPSSIPTVSPQENRALADPLVELGFVRSGEPLAGRPFPEPPLPVPACNQQGPFTVNGHSSQFPQVTEASK